MERLLIPAVAAILLSTLLFAGALPDRRDEEGLAAATRTALEAGDASALARLFPRDRKIRASLDRIADLDGFIGPGPLVEALRRYLAGRSEVRFEGGADASPESGTVRVRGLLSSRDGAGRRDQVRLMFAFERLDGQWRAVEIRETG